MSDSARGENPASPRRRQQARQQGRVPRSREFIFAMMYAVTGATLLWYGPQFLFELRDRLRTDLQSAARPLQDPMSFLQQYLIQLGWWLLPWLLVISLAVVAAHWVQHGPLWLPERVQLNLTRLNPASGLQRLIQPDSLATLLLSGIKIVLLSALAVWLVRDQWDRLLRLSTNQFEHSVASGAALLCRFGAWLGVGLLIWGGVDFAWQMYRHERDLQMSPDEQREDIRAVHNDVSTARQRRQQNG